MKKRLLLLITIFCSFNQGNALPQNCGLDWQSSDLATGIEGPKKYYGDTNIAYAVFSFPSDPSTVYRIKGMFPRARYMSIESSELIDIGNWDFDAIQDHKIIPDVGSVNPFTPGVALGASPRNFTVDAVPSGGEWVAVNRLEFPTNGNTNQIWLRIVAPNAQVAFNSLPTIEAYDLATGLPKTECPQAQVANYSKSNDPLESVAQFKFADLSRASYADEAFNLTEDFSDLGMLDLEGALLGILKTAVPEKQWAFSFRLIEIPFEGSSAIPGYSYGLTKMGPGKVALVKFKAPSFMNTNDGDDEALFVSGEDLRYSSLCSLDLADGRGLACIPDHLMKKDAKGFVTIVYGPAGGVVESKVQALGYNFLPDNRVALNVAEQPVAFVYRQMLPSVWFSQNGLNKGDYVPRARVCSERWFLSGFCVMR
jgi:hypothetical protein